MKRLPSFIKTISGLALALLVIVTCKKEYSYEGGRQAVYTFIGAPDTCTAAHVFGTYTAGVPADSSNQVLINVKLSAPGFTQVATGEVDGLTFNTGKLYLVDIPDSVNYGLLLYAKGTPKDTGVFEVAIPGAPGCSFVLTVTGASPSGYTLSGAPDECGNPVTQGSYSKGIAMTSDNLVTINVEVASEGPYHMTTDKQNGISFSGSGTFTSTGKQQVVLQATGTPDNAELTRLLLTAGNSVCSFYVAVTNSGPVATYVLQSSVVDNISYCAPGSVQGNYAAGTALAAGNTLTVNAYVTATGNYTISTREINGMTFSASGTFTTVGAQDVILMGSGTPAATGTYTFFPQIVGPAPLGGSDCGLDVVVK